MRDPLQTEPALDELLSVPPGATEREVNAAFAQALAGARPDVPRLTAARKLLLRDPVECKLLRALRYDDEWLSVADPCPLGDPECMQVNRRGETAERWEALLRDRFPDPRLVHCLAVEWYWWALAASRGETGTGDQDLAELWRRAIAYWAALAADEAFLREVLGDGSDDVSLFVTKLIDRLRRQIHEALLAPTASADLAGLDAQLSTEVRSARIAATVAGSRRPMSAGVMLLERLGRAESMRQLLAACGRTDEDVRWLAGLLSPLGEVVALLDARRVSEALAALETLTGAERETSEASSLFVRAYTLRARQESEMGRGADAIDSYELALAHAPDGPNEEIRAAMRAAATSMAVKASGGPATDKVITALEKAHQLAPDDQLAALLADRLTDRGVRRFREGQEALERSGGPATESVKRKLRSGLKDLKRGNELGSARAAEQLAIADRFYRAMLETLPSEVDAHMKRATDAAQREDWDAAIKHLRLAAKAMGRRPHREIKQALATVLVNRAMLKADHAISGANAAISSASPGAMPAVQLFEAWQELSEALNDLNAAKAEDPGMKGLDDKIKHVRGNRDSIASALAMPAGFELTGTGATTSSKARSKSRLRTVLQYAAALAVAAPVLYGIAVLADLSPAFKSALEATLVVLWIAYMLWSVFSK